MYDYTNWTASAGKHASRTLSCFLKKPGAYFYNQQGAAIAASDSCSDGQWLLEQGGFVPSQQVCECTAPVQLSLLLVEMVALRLESRYYRSRAAVVPGVSPALRAERSRDTVRLRCELLSCGNKMEQPDDVRAMMMPVLSLAC